MSDLQNRLDVLGWYSIDEPYEYGRELFRWLEDATKEIDRLAAIVENLQEERKP